LPDHLRCEEGLFALKFGVRRMRRLRRRALRAVFAAAGHARYASRASTGSGAPFAHLDRKRQSVMRHLCCRVPLLAPAWADCRLALDDGVCLRPARIRAALYAASAGWLSARDLPCHQSDSRLRLIGAGRGCRADKCACPISARVMMVSLSTDRKWLVEHGGQAGGPHLALTLAG
jgi:hypothetical protein